MKIAFTSSGTDWDAIIDPRFGRTDYILLYDEEKDELVSVDNRQIMQVAHGAGPQTAQKIFELMPQVLITGNGPGGNAEAILRQMHLQIHTGAGGMTLREAYNAYKNNQLPMGGKNA
ncbi:NifB/NifX family molybdenum-iron cluster-binding protein [Candidatus Cloacimonadaceae bacterium]